MKKILTATAVMAALVVSGSAFANSNVAAKKINHQLEGMSPVVLEVMGNVTHDHNKGEFVALTNDAATSLYAGDTAGSLISSVKTDTTGSNGIIVLTVGAGKNIQAALRGSIITFSPYDEANAAVTDGSAQVISRWECSISQASGAVSLSEFGKHELNLIPSFPLPFNQCVLGAAQD